MAEDIVANTLEAKKITSQDITVNDIDIVEYIKSKIAEVELDPVFKKWLETDSRLSDIGKNEISDYAKVVDIPTADSFKNNFLSSNIRLSSINNNEISVYALSTDVEDSLSDLKDYIDDQISGIEDEIKEI